MESLEIAVRKMTASEAFELLELAIQFVNLVLVGLMVLVVRFLFRKCRVSASRTDSISRVFPLLAMITCPVDWTSRSTFDGSISIRNEGTRIVDLSLIVHCYRLGIPRLRRSSSYSAHLDQPTSMNTCDARFRLDILEGPRNAEQRRARAGSELTASVRHRFTLANVEYGE